MALGLPLGRGGVKERPDCKVVNPLSLRHFKDNSKQGFYVFLAHATCGSRVWSPKETTLIMVALECP